MKLKNKDGYILIEVCVFIIITSMLCVSLAMIISNKISINNNDRINKNLYITAKSTISVLEDYFDQDKALLKTYATKNEEGTFYLEGRQDIKYILASFSLYDTNRALIEVTVFDNFDNQIKLSSIMGF